MYRNLAETSLSIFARSDSGVSSVQSEEESMMKGEGVETGLGEGS